MNEDQTQRPAGTPRPERRKAPPLNVDPRMITSIEEVQGDEEIPPDLFTRMWNLIFEPIYSRLVRNRRRARRAA